MLTESAGGAWSKPPIILAGCFAGQGGGNSGWVLAWGLPRVQTLTEGSTASQSPVLAGIQAGWGAGSGVRCGFRVSSCC